MKLATYRDGSRDGQLLVVARDLATAHYATGIANTLQQVLDDWTFHAPQLQDLFDTLNSGKTRHAFPFDPQQCMAPLPRAYQWAEGAAYAPRAERGRPAKTAAQAPRAEASPAMVQGASDDLGGPLDDIVCASEALGIDFAAQIAVITDDVRRAATPEQALEGIRLVMLANGVRLRQVMPDELDNGVGTVQSQSITAFSPVALTLDELGDAWRKGRLNLNLQSTWNERRVGLCEAGAEMTFHFGQLIAHLSKTRRVRAGSIVSSGAVRSQKANQGYSTIAEKRALETLQDGQPSTEFMRFGDTIRIEMKGSDGRSLFGAIEQAVVPLAHTRDLS